MQRECLCPCVTEIVFVMILAEYSWMVDLVLLAVPLGMDRVWTDYITIRGHHRKQSSGGRSSGKHQLEGIHP